MLSPASEAIPRIDRLAAEGTHEDLEQHRFHLRAVCRLWLGDIDGARQLAEEGLRRSERVGDRGQIVWFHGILCDDEFGLGHLDRALLLAEAVLEHGPEHYQAQVAYQVRARIRLARDSVAEALSDVERGIELTRRASGGAGSGRTSGHR